MTEDEIKDGDEIIDEAENEDEISDDEMVPLVLGDDEVEDDSDEAIVAEGFSGTEEGIEEFDPEDPDAYLYNTPQVKYADSAEEDEGVWSSEDEF